MRRFLGVLGALALMTGVVVVGAAPVGAAPSIRVVWPGESIQAVIDASAPGDTVVMFRGTYAEHVTITKRLHLIGWGARLVPPSGEAPPNPCSFGAPAADGICIAGRFTATDTGIRVNRYVANVSISGLTIRGFAGSGINQIGGRGSTFAGNVARDNAEYGFAAFSSIGTSVLFNTAVGSEEAGFYFGDSSRANVTMIGNRASDNLFGAFIRNAEHGTIASNQTTGNCVGILFLGDAPGPSGAFSVVSNTISNNTKACPPTEEGPPASGVGVLILGAHHVTIQANRILDNHPSGPSFATGGVVLQTGFGGTAPRNNEVQGNVIKRNSTDVVWDGTGAGNVLTPNACQTSDPSGLC